MESKRNFLGIRPIAYVFFASFLRGSIPSKEMKISSLRRRKRVTHKMRLKETTAIFEIIVCATLYYDYYCYHHCFRCYDSSQEIEIDDHGFRVEAETNSLCMLRVSKYGIPWYPTAGYSYITDIRYVI